MDGDIRLRQRLAAGDDGALQHAYDHFSSLVHGLALRVTRSREAAEEITQDVFVHLWENPYAFDPGRGTLRTWLAMLAHRRAVDWVRREERQRRLLDAVERTEPAVPILDVIIADETGVRVRHAVAALPQRLREAVELAYYRGRTYRQAAIELGLPEGTVKSRIRSGLRTIADALAEEEGAP
ncbi:sigma-70 family RNA polymerase sigma factor [Actinomadura decatromicini]|uniref:Sigma-70 family RNA polymerase sigma factor n=1 Tax=Actinomadura decatromicini TaxID=2604572 RepID=A0A5D3FL05_9ACTN|nr:sigma-70 family RNA polymerase sigma factor [Actinomadura decatromicini]TYK49527.1 sigma-70 family RNA polymerase sigma factor [Actinomadura decatromicini]